MDINIGPGLWTMDPDAIPCHSQWAKHHYGSGSSLALRYQHGLRWLTRPWAFGWCSVVTEVMDINSDPGCCRAIGPGMILGSVLGPNVIIGQAKPLRSARPQRQGGPKTPTWSEIVTQTLGIPVAFSGNMGHKCQ